MLQCTSSIYNTRLRVIEYHLDSVKTYKTLGKKKHKNSFYIDILKYLYLLII